MATALASAAQAAHSVAVSILGHAQIQPGMPIPVNKGLKENGPEEPLDMDLSGKNIIVTGVGVPGAFSGTCSNHVPPYISTHDEFKAKGVNNVYIICVNDIFVMKAWKEKLAPGGTGVRFVADDKGAFTGSMGLLYDASVRLGGPRSKRYVIIAVDGKVSSIAVEEIPRNIIVTEARAVLERL